MQNVVIRIGRRRTRPACAIATSSGSPAACSFSDASSSMTPFFTTRHFDGHLSVLLRASRVGELSRQELAEVIQEAWLSRASRRRGADWLAANPLG